MDIAPTATASTKSPEPEPDAPTRIQPLKPLSFTNGVLKRHHPQLSGGGGAPVVVSYKECLKNHAASLGGHALDGCGEFMPSPTATSADPTSLKCAACGCHRNFHRREPEEPPHTHVIEYQPHHRHHPPPPHGSPNSSSPPPISSSYYPSAPHMLLALSAANHHDPSPPNQASRKRFRTKFSQTQKEKMQEFADRVGWKIQKIDDELVHRFCEEVGVDRGVLKVWMHNNKNTLGGKRDANANGIGIGIAHDAAGENPHDQNHRHHNGGGGAAAAANGSSSSS